VGRPTIFPLGAAKIRSYTPANFPERDAHRPLAIRSPERRARRESNPSRHRSEGFVKQAEETTFVDLIACERDCRTCSYAAALDCDGNCGVCPHNGYCPCVNPVVVRSKSALRLIELRPILLQDLRVPKN
jgi:hypothetical protein